MSTQKSPSKYAVTPNRSGRTSGYSKSQLDDFFENAKRFVPIYGAYLDPGLEKPPQKAFKGRGKSITGKSDKYKALFKRLSEQQQNELTALENVWRKKLENSTQAGFGQKMIKAATETYNFEKNPSAAESEEGGAGESKSPDDPQVAKGENTTDANMELVVQEADVVGGGGGESKSSDQPPPDDVLQGNTNRRRIRPTSTPPDGGGGGGGQEEQQAPEEPPAPPLSPRRVEIDRGVPGQSSLPASFTTKSNIKMDMERNRMKYSGEKLFYEITAFVKIYRDEIKTIQFKELARKSKTVSAKSELKKLRELHRELEEEIMDYYNKQKGMRIGVILDPAAVGLDVGQLQSILNPEMAFNAGGQTVTELAQAQDNPIAPERATQVMDTHYHHGGIAVATNQVLPEVQNIIKNERPLDRTRLIKSKTAPIPIPQEATRRYLYFDRRRSVKPPGIVIKSKKC